ncbi:MAG: four helix bundle protein [Gemmatimonadaceae bacterium]|nr:four helix bundle protein [Gemmatimonadaceae bacterium]
MTHDPPHAIPKATPSGDQDLRVWQSAVDLAAECYARSARFPAHERFGMTAQMRRAAVAAVSNIAEGQGRDSAGAFANHLSVARGSVKELESQAILAMRLGLTTAQEMEQLLEMCASVSRMLHSLRKSLAAPSVPAPSNPGIHADAPE